MHYSNPTSEEIRNAITTRSQNFVDVIVPFDELNCELTESGDSTDFRYSIGIADFSTHAFSQLLTRVRFSIDFWKRLDNGDAHQLKVDNFNWCNENTANKISNQRRNNNPSYLFRLNPSTPISATDLLGDVDDEEEDRVAPSLRTPVRAILSGSYSVFNDDELFPMLMDELDEDDNVSYTFYEYDDHITRLHIKFDDTEVTHDNIKYSAGMVITNSEVGSSSIWIEPVVYQGDSLYANRRSLTKQEVQMKIVHRGDIDRERVTEIFRNCADISQVGIVQLVEAFQTKINPNYALSLVKNIPELPNRMALLLEDEWEREEDLKQAEVAQAILEMAQELPLFQRAKVEQAAGKIIGLFDGYASRMVQIMEDMED
tara:strand:- start:88 stop:1203 length:1116 start_codon:yes stop_codon:yes gene_type:complete